MPGASYPNGWHSVQEHLCCVGLHVKMEDTTQDGWEIPRAETGAIGVRSKGNRGPSSDRSSGGCNSPKLSLADPGTATEGLRYHTVPSGSETYVYKGVKHKSLYLYGSLKNWRTWPNKTHIINVMFLKNEKEWLNEITISPEISAHTGFFVIL